MSPELHAAADAFVYDVAMVLHVTDLLGEPGLALRNEGTAWSLRQTVGHLAANYEKYAAAFERRLAGERAIPPRDPSRSNEAIAEAERDTPSAELAGRLLEARRRILAALAAFSPGQETSPLSDGSRSLLEVAGIWSRHGAEHAVDFLEAAPHLAGDRLVLNWVFHPMPGESPDLDRRRQALLARLGASQQKGS
jgi:hypothetical protein